jgi:hypothetical protein
MGKTPKVPAAPPLPPPPPTMADEAAKEARKRERQRNMLAAGRRSTILTGPQGVTSAAAIGSNTLLGGGQ